MEVVVDAAFVVGDEKSVTSSSCTLAVQSNGNQDVKGWSPVNGGGKFFA